MEREKEREIEGHRETDRAHLKIIWISRFVNVKEWRNKAAHDVQIRTYLDLVKSLTMAQKHRSV